MRRRLSKSSSRSSFVLFTENLSTKDAFIVTNVTFMYVVFPTIIRLCLQTFRYETICNTVYFAVDTQVEYLKNGGEHVLFAFFIALPGLVLYLAVMPIAVVQYLWLRRQNLHNRKTVFRMGLLFSGYKDQRWWWELITLIRKVSIIFISTFVDENYEQIQWAMAVIIVLLYVQERGKPFAGKSRGRLHRLEVSSILLVCLMLWASAFFERGEQCSLNDFLCQFLGLLIVLTNIMFLVVCIGWFCIDLRSDHKTTLNQISKKIRKTRRRLSVMTGIGGGDGDQESGSHSRPSSALSDGVPPRLPPRNAASPRLPPRPNTTKTNVLSNSAAVRGSVEVGGEVELTTFARQSRARTISTVPDENERNHIQEMMEMGGIHFPPSETVSGGGATVVQNPLVNYFSDSSDDAANTSGNSISVGGGGGGGGRGGNEKVVSKIERERLQRLVLMRKKVGRRSSIGGRRNSVGGRRRSSDARQKKSNK